MQESIDERLQPQTNSLSFRTRTLVCPDCGTEAACDCGVAPIDRAAYALLKYPERSDRSIAAEIGVGKDTVRRARKATGAPAPVEKRIGLDGRARRVPQTSPVEGEITVTAAQGVVRSETRSAQKPIQKAIFALEDLPAELPDLTLYRGAELGPVITAIDELVNFLGVYKAQLLARGAA